MKLTWELFFFCCRVALFASIPMIMFLEFIQDDLRAYTESPTYVIISPDYLLLPDDDSQ